MYIFIYKYIYILNKQLIMSVMSFPGLSLFLSFFFLRRDSVTRFLTLNFLNKKTPPGPHMTRQKLYRKIFNFCEDIHEKHVSA